MKVLVVGSGGREHTLVWKIKQSPRVESVYCVPGNAGIAQNAICEPLPVKPPFAELIEFAKQQEIELVAVGPEAPTGMLGGGLANWISEKRKLPKETQKTNVMAGVLGAYGELFTSPFFTTTLFLRRAQQV